MSDFREIQIKKKFNLISCVEMSKSYLNDKCFLISILNSQIDKYWKKAKTKISEIDIRVPTDLLIDDRGSHTLFSHTLFFFFLQINKMYWVNNVLRICYSWLLSERKLGIEKYIHLSELTQRYWIFVNLTLWRRPDVILVYGVLQIYS